jgi:nucleoside 2-deoxyribosyltransferase
MKYRDLVKKVTDDFTKIGITPLFPNLDYSTENKDHANTIEEKKRLAFEHYEAINEADAVYFITPKGYMGTSCKLELGYAIAKNKPIYFSEPTNDIGLDCYVKKFIPVNSLKKFLEI